MKKKILRVIIFAFILFVYCNAGYCGGRKLKKHFKSEERSGTRLGDAYGFPTLFSSLNPQTKNPVSDSSFNWQVVFNRWVFEWNLISFYQFYMSNGVYFNGELRPQGWLNARRTEIISGYSIYKTKHFSLTPFTGISLGGYDYEDGINYGLNSLNSNVTCWWFPIGIKTNIDIPGLFLEFNYKYSPYPLGSANVPNCPLGVFNIVIGLSLFHG